jgi:hypothetical protein
MVRLAREVASIFTSCVLLLVAQFARAETMTEAQRALMSGHTIGEFRFGRTNPCARAEFALAFNQSVTIDGSRWDWATLKLIQHEGDVLSFYVELKGADAPERCVYKVSIEKID